MSKPMTTVDGVEREMNDIEYAQYQKDVAEMKSNIDAKAKAEADKAALLAKLGITADEARLLFS